MFCPFNLEQVLRPSRCFVNSSTRENLKERKTNGARGGGGEGAASIKHERQPGRGFLSVCNCKYLIKQKTTHLAHNHMLTMALGVAGLVRRMTGPPPRSNRGTHTHTVTHRHTLSCIVLLCQQSLASHTVTLQHFASQNTIKLP